MIINCAECDWFQPKIFNKTGLCLYGGINKAKQINDRNKPCILGIKFKEEYDPPLRRAV